MTNFAEIERRALDAAAASDRRDGPYRAEIISRETPCWHIVRTAPGQEKKAYDFLARRGFGVFLPKFVKGSRLVQNRKVEDLSDQLIFRGKVFLWCWDVLAHWRRIKACPGVQGIMVDHNGKPVVMPDREIHQIQGTEQKHAVARSKRRKRYSSAEDTMTISSADYLHVDGRHRSRVLDAASVLPRSSSALSECSSMVSS